jgi:hypothetical protein
MKDKEFPMRPEIMLRNLMDIRRKTELLVIKMENSIERLDEDIRLYEEIIRKRGGDANEESIREK